MIENIRRFPVGTAILIGIYYAVGVIGLGVESTRPFFQKLIPVTLLFSLYFIWLFHENPDRRFYLSWLIIFLLGFFIEVIGVNTGMIFGDYSYGKSLGIKLIDTPIMIGVNWLLLIYSCWALIGLFTGNRLLGALAGSSLMLLYDFALEPVAIRLDMWNWFLAPVPVQNYVAWFLISFIFFLIFSVFFRRIENKIAPAMFITQIMFFIALNIVFYLS